MLGATTKQPQKPAQRLPGAKTKGQGMTYWDSNSLHHHSHLEQLTAAQGSVAKTLADKIRYDGKYQTSADRLATLAGVNKRTVLGAVKRLEELGILSVENAGGRNATVYTWHSCAPGCVDGDHTGKKDTRRTRYLFAELPEAITETKPKSKTRQRREAKQRVTFGRLKGANEVAVRRVQVMTASEPASGALSDSASGALCGALLGRSGALGAPLKDKSKSQNRLKTENPAPAITDDRLTISVTLHQQAESYSALADGAYADVLWQLLDDENHHLHVIGFAEEILSAPLEDSDHLRHFVQKYALYAGLDISPLLDVVNQYRAWPGKLEPWHRLSRSVRLALVAGRVSLDQFADDALKMSEVGPTLAETAPGYSFPAHDVQVANLTRRLSAITPE